MTASIEHTNSEFAESETQSLPSYSGEYSMVHDLQEVASNMSPFISNNQICQVNVRPKNTSTSFDCSQFLALPSSQAKQPAIVSESPFEIKFITLSSCRNGYARPSDGKSCLPPPLALCLIHKEQHLYSNVIYGKQQLSRLTNVHYHANASCPRIRFANFNPNSVQVPEDVGPKLKPEHWLFLLQCFGIA